MLALPELAQHSHDLYQEAPAASRHGCLFAGLPGVLGEKSSDEGREA